MGCHLSLVGSQSDFSTNLSWPLSSQQPAHYPLPSAVDRHTNQLAGDCYQAGIMETAGAKQAAAYLVAVLHEVECGCHLHTQALPKLLVLLVAVQLVQPDVWLVLHDSSGNQDQRC